MAEDITKTGPRGLKGLKGINEQNNTHIRPELKEFFDSVSSMSRGELSSAFRTEAVEAAGLKAAQAGYGDSMYDEHALVSQLDDLNEVRAAHQGIISKFASAIGKGVALAGTTFLDGTIGLAYGAYKGFSNLADDDPNTGFWQGLWNNEISLGLNEFNKYLEKELPNYYSKEEQNMNPLQKMGTANFWADGLLKNMGFMVGALYSGKAILAPLKFFKVVKSSLGAQVVGSLFSGVNEGRIEATQLYKDTKDLSNLQIQDQYNKRKQEILESDLSDYDKVEQLTQLEKTTEGLKQDAENRANAAAGIDLLANSILLPLDNFMTYGKLYGRGFKNVKNLGENNVKKSWRQRSKEAVQNAEKEMSKELEGHAKKKGAEYIWNNITKKEVAGKVAADFIREGNEEMAQQFFSSTAGYMYQPESPDAYYKAMINNQTQIEAQDALTAMTKGFADSYGDGSQWEQFIIGGLTALIGSPTFGKKANSDSNTYLGRGKMIGLSGGVFGELAHTNDINRRGQAAVDDINKTSKKVRDGKINLAMSMAFNNDMDGYAKENDKFEYENAADNDLFRLFSRLVSIGREADFKEMVDQDFDNISDEELEKIAGFTSQNPDVLNHADGFRNEDGTLMSSTPEGRQKMREKLKEKKEHLLKQMESYKDALGTVRGMSNNSLTPDQEDELAWLLWKSKRFYERAKEIKERYGEGLSAVLEATEARIKELEEALNLKLQKHDILTRTASNESALTGDFREIEAQLSENSSTIKDLKDELSGLRLINQTIQSVKSGDPLSGLVIDNLTGTDSKGNKISFASFLLSDRFYNAYVRYGKGYTQYKEGLTAVLDTVKLANARKLFNEKLAEYMGKPEKLIKNRERLDQQEAQKTEDTNKVKAKDKVSHASVSELRGLEEDELDGLEEALEDSDSEGLAKIAEAKKINGAENAIIEDINRQVSEGSISTEEAQDAIDLLGINGVDANSLEELEDLDSEAVLAASVDTSELEEVLREATENGTKSTEEALAELNAEKERRKDAARTVLSNSIRKVQEDRQRASTMPQSAPAVFDEGSSPGKDTGGATAIPVVPSAPVDKSGYNIVDYIKELASKGYSEKDIFEGIKDLAAYQNAIDIGFTEEDIKNEIRRAIAEEIRKKESGKPEAPADNGAVSVDSTDMADDDSEDFNSTAVDFEKAIDDEHTAAPDQGTKPVNGTYTYWRPATTEFRIHRSRGDNQPYYKTANVNAATRSRYEAVWNFLKRLNVFERVKTLKNNDVVHFGISKELSKATGIPVLLILNERNEVIGDLPVQSDSNFNAYPGLDDAYKTAAAYFNEHKDDSPDDIVVIEGMKSTVNGKLIGKPQYTSREDIRTLNKINIVEQSDGSKKRVPFKLGVALSSGSGPRIMVTPGRRRSQGQTSEELAVQRPLRATKGQPFMLMETSKQRGGTNEKVRVCVPISMPKFSINNPQVASPE